MLQVRTDKTYQYFFFELQKIAFSKKVKQKKKIKKKLFELFQKYSPEPKVISILRYVDEHIDELTNHLKTGGCPKTNNMIESYNKQLNGRLKTIQGFENFEKAERWLSAWILRRRLTPFTDCRGKFKKLNGKTSLEKTLKGNLKLPDFF